MLYVVLALRYKRFTQSQYLKLIPLSVGCESIIVH